MQRREYYDNLLWCTVIFCMETALTKHGFLFPSTFQININSSSTGMYKQSQNNFISAAMIQEHQQQLQLIPSAKNIQQLLSNIGAAHRCSQSTIETLIQKRNSSSNNVNNNLSADEMIDLIAQIRSI